VLKKILLGALTIVILLCGAGGLFLYSKVNADIDEHFVGSCEAVELQGSGEDIQIDRDYGIAYLSMLDRLGVAQGEDIEPGMVMRVNLNHRPYTAEPALMDGPALHPHGLSLYKDAAGNQSLFVINHPEDRASGAEAIEKYTETEPGSGLYRHAETFASPLITRANDMVATGPRQFYVAQDVAQGSGDTQTQLVYFDGTGYRSVADNIESGGGINVSADGSTLYIAETGGMAIRVAHLNENGDIESSSKIPLQTSPDNIDVAADGALWVGGHSNVVALAMHFIIGSKAPTQILRIADAGGDPRVDEIYLNAGDEISAGSGGTTLGNKLLIGSITARKILACEMED